MRIIIAPAKKMMVDTDNFAVDGLPQFLEQTERLKTVLQGISPQDLQVLWKCNDSIAKLNIDGWNRWICAAISPPPFFPTRAFSTATWPPA